MDGGFFEYQGLSFLFSMECLEEVLQLTLAVFQYHDFVHNVFVAFFHGMVQLFMFLILFSSQCLAKRLEPASRLFLECFRYSL